MKTKRFLLAIGALIAFAALWFSVAAPLSGGTIIGS